MVLSEQINNLFTDVQNCSDLSECINFDLTKSLESFLSHLDKSILEYVQKKDREDVSDDENDIDSESAKEKETTKQFNSAAVFVEGCVKIFSQKIEYLHNLAHNALYNIYREHKPGTQPKKHFLSTVFEEDYLFVNEMKCLKNISHEHEIRDDDLLVKTIPFPTFLFNESIKEKQTQANEIAKEQEEQNKENEEESEEENELQNDKSKKSKNKKKIAADEKLKEEMEKISEFAVSENTTVGSLNFQKLYLEDEGILLLDINDYNVFINEQYDFSKQGSKSALLFEKFDLLSQQSFHSCANFSEFIEDTKAVEDDMRIIDMDDLLSDSICYDYFMFKKNRDDYDLALGILKNKETVLKKFNSKNDELTVLEENTHIDTDRPLVLDNIIRCLPYYYSINCSNIENYKTFFRYIQPSEIVEIIKENSMPKHKKKEQSLHEHKERNTMDRKNEKKMEDRKLSDDEKIYEEITIPELYIQKLNLNISYYYLEPLIHNLIKNCRKKRNVEKFFSIDIDDKPRISFEDANEEDENDIKNQGQKNITLDTFMGGLNDANANGDFTLGQDLDRINLTEQSLVAYGDSIHDRVGKWNQFLEKKLEILKRQPKFDVDTYKKNLINYTINHGYKTNFSKLINNKEPYEICRNFLTTLMLINTGVLEIRKTKHADSTNDVNNYQIKIKENKANHFLHGNVIKNASFVLSDNKRKKDTVFVPTKKVKKTAAV